MGWGEVTLTAYDQNGDPITAEGVEPYAVTTDPKGNIINKFVVPDGTESFAFQGGGKQTEAATELFKYFYTLEDQGENGRVTVMEYPFPDYYAVKGNAELNRIITAHVKNDERSCYRFTPEEDMTVRFFSLADNGEYTIGYLYPDDPTSDYIEYFDFGNSSNFSGTCSLTGGQTYYFGVRKYYYNNEVTDIPFIIEPYDDSSNESFEITSVNAVGSGHGNFMNNHYWDYNENEMTELSKGLYSITFENVEANGCYDFYFIANHDEDIWWGEYSQINIGEERTILYRYNYPLYFYTPYSETDTYRVTLIFDARDFSSSNNSVKTKVLCEPMEGSADLLMLVLAQNPTKTDYVAGEKVDLSGMILTVIYNNGTSEQVQNCAASPLVVDENTEQITLSYKGKTASFPVTVSPAELTGIELTKLPNQRNYWTGDELNTEGLAVSAVYNNGMMKVPVTDYTVHADLSTPGVKTVTVSYGDLTASFEVNVNALYISYLDVSRYPDKTQYFRGEEFDPEGMEITAHYNSGKTSIINDYTVSEFDSTNFGWSDIRITADDLRGGTQTVYFSVEIIPRPLAVAITYMPTRLEYVAGEDIDPAGMQVYVIKDDGSAQIVPDPGVLTNDKEIRFTDNQGWDSCMMTVCHKNGEVSENWCNYTEYNDYGETVFVFNLPYDAAQIRFYNYYDETECTELITEFDVSGYYTDDEMNENDEYIAHPWTADNYQSAYPESYTVSSLKPEAGRQLVEVQYNGKSAYFFVDVYDLGDVDRNGVIDICDATAIQRHAAGLEELSDIGQRLADVNGDGVVDITDVSMLQMFIAGCIDSFETA